MQIFTLVALMFSVKLLSNNKNLNYTVNVQVLYTIICKMKSDGIIFNKNLFDIKIKNPKMDRNLHCRRKLQEKFEECDVITTSTPNSDNKNQTTFTSFTLEDTRKVFRSSIDKITKTFTYVKTSLDTFSQVGSFLNVAKLALKTYNFIVAI